MTNEMRYFIEWRILVWIITFHLREHNRVFTKLFQNSSLDNCNCNQWALEEVEPSSILVVVLLLSTEEEIIIIISVLIFFVSKE